MCVRFPFCLYLGTLAEATPVAPRWVKQSSCKVLRVYPFLFSSFHCLWLSSWHQSKSPSQEEGVRGGNSGREIHSQNEALILALACVRSTSRTVPTLLSCFWVSPFVTGDYTPHSQASEYPAHWGFNPQLPPWGMGQGCPWEYANLSHSG